VSARSETCEIIRWQQSLVAFFLHSGVEMSWQFPANPAIAFALAGVLGWYDRWQRRGMGTPPAAPRHPGLRIAVLLVLFGAAAASVTLLAAEREFLAGRRLFRSGRWAEASDRFQKAMQLNPLDPRLPSAQAASFQQMPRGIERADPLIRKAASLDRMNAYYPVQLAEALLPHARGADALHEVERQLKSALDLDPLHYPEAYARLAQLYAKQGRVEDAAIVYERAVAFYAARSIAGDMVRRIMLWPRVAALFSESAAFLAAQGKTDDAVAVLDVLLRQDAAWQPAYRQIADLYQKAHRDRDAYFALVAGRAQLPDALGVSVTLPRLPGVVHRVYPR